MTSNDDRRLWLRGELVAHEDAVVHISSETALRGANVFEGIRGYPTPDGIGYLALDAHLSRLLMSARMLGIAHGYTAAHFTEAIAALVAHADPAEDTYIRPSIVIESGRLPSDSNYRAIDYVSMAAVPRHDLYRGASAIVSRWARPAASSLPPQMKAGGSYLAFRLPLLERAQYGADHVIVQNERGQVAEAEGAAVFMVRGETLVTPPVNDGGLRSITRSILLRAAAALGIDAVEESVTVAGLYEADGVFLAGTLCELAPLERLDGLELSTVSLGVYRALAEDYAALRDGAPSASGERLEPIMIGTERGDREPARR